MNTFLLYLFLVFSALTLQATIFKGIKPDFVLILVCFYSLAHGQLRGMAYGALAGALLDSASGFILGPNMLSKSIAGFFMRSIRQKLFHWNAIINALVIAILAIIDIFSVYIILETFLKISFIHRPWRISIMQIIYTALVALIVYPILNPERGNK